MRASSELLYDHVRAQLQSLTSRFGHQHFAPDFLQAFELLCSEPLALPLGRRNPDFSRINEDGTPFQISLTLGSGPPAFGFLSEVGGPRLSNEQRAALAVERVGAVATVLDCASALTSCRGLLQRLAPLDCTELAADHGGVFWIGVAFPPDTHPCLRIYINSGWGSESNNWSRLDLVASYFGAQADWRSHKPLLDGLMRPLGVSLNLCQDRQPVGRIYTRAYGNPLSYYEGLAKHFAGPAFAKLFTSRARVLLAEDFVYPTKSVVCSFGFTEGQETDFKCEFCAHCIFANDVQATSRCREWLTPVPEHSRAYVDFLHAITKGEARESQNGLHSFMGMGYKHRQPYCTLYFNPGAPWSVSGDREWTTKA